MRVLIAHNAYRYRGGEEQAIESDRALLEAKGHHVELYVRKYDELAPNDGILRGARLALAAFWSARTYLEVRRLIRAGRPDVLHVHNIFPLISASVYRAAHAERVPVVQTLHNYRLVCPASTLLRDGKPCELCVGTAPWRAVRYRCYRDSRLQSLALATILTTHRALGTWSSDVDAYVALTEFGRRLFVRGGLPPDRIFVRHNAVHARARHPYHGARSAIFVGRLSREKGVKVLLDAWRALPEVPLEIIGDGPLAAEVHAAAMRPELAHVRVLGQLPHGEVLEHVARAGMLVFPSVCYEGFALAIAEALAQGIPVIGSRLGAQAEIVRDGVSGLLFRAGDANALRDAVRRVVDTDGLADDLSRGARAEFDSRFSPDISYRALIDIYRRVATSASA